MASDDQIVDFLLTTYKSYVHPSILMRLLLHRYAKQSIITLSVSYMYMKVSMIEFQLHLNPAISNSQEGTKFVRNSESSKYPIVNN